MPADTNAYGDIFGGWLLAQMDLAAASYAIQRARGRVATVGIEAMSFHLPVFVGDQVSCYCRTVRVGNTSIAVHVETWARRRHEDENIHADKVTEGTFTFVALNPDGSKRAVPRCSDSPSTSRG
jgi:acyl-CoA thioesterase YciA